MGAYRLHRAESRSVQRQILSGESLARINGILVQSPDRNHPVRNDSEPEKHRKRHLPLRHQQQFHQQKTQNGKIDLANLSRYGVLLQQPEHAELDVPRRLQSGKYPARKRNQSAVSRLPRRLCEIHSDSAFFRKYFLDK